MSGSPVGAKRRLPGIEAVVISLGYDFALAEFQKHGGVTAHLAAGAQRCEWDGQSAGPECLEGDEISGYGFVRNLVGLAGEDLSAFFEG